MRSTGTCEWAPTRLVRCSKKHMESSHSSVAVVTPSIEPSEAESESDKPPPASSLSLVQPIPRQSAPSAVFDLERVPMHLREIFIYAQRWGMANPAERRVLLARTTDGELRQVADAVAPYIDDIRAWSQTGEPCSELETYLALAEAHQEIEYALAT